jgi:hypothetical protein
VQIDVIYVTFLLFDVCCFVVFVQQVASETYLPSNFGDCWRYNSEYYRTIEHCEQYDLDILPHLSLTAAALVSGKEGDSFYAACKD